MSKRKSTPKSDSSRNRAGDAWGFEKEWLADIQLLDARELLRRVGRADQVLDHLMVQLGYSRARHNEYCIGLAAFARRVLRGESPKGKFRRQRRRSPTDGE